MWNNLLCFVVLLYIFNNYYINIVNNYFTQHMLILNYLCSMLIVAIFLCHVKEICSVSCKLWWLIDCVDILQFWIISIEPVSFFFFFFLLCMTWLCPIFLVTVNQAMREKNFLKVLPISLSEINHIYLWCWNISHKN